MQVDTTAAAHAVNIYQELKFWIPIVTIAGLFLKTSAWLKNLATKDDLKNQTDAIVTQLKEIRQDFRTAMQPPPRPARARSSKKKIDTVFEHHV
jgi:hypothetical protein